MNEPAGLADLTAFLAVADHLSFRAPASRFRVPPSALSHSMRQLEYYFSFAGAVGGDSWRRRAAIAK
jgi:hypothetical protein